MKKIINYLILLLFITIFYKCAFKEKFYHTILYYKIVNVSDSNIIVYYSYHVFDSLTSADTNQNGSFVKKNEKEILSKDSVLIGPFYHPLLIKDVYQIDIGVFFDDTILIKRKDTISIKKNLYDKTNWDYIIIKVKHPKRFDLDTCIMQLNIYNKDF
jgi:hypothetical protein